MYREDVLSSGPKLPGYIPVVSNYPQETCDAEREAAQLPALAHTGQKVIFSTSETFYLFPWFSVCFIVVSDPILLSLQSRGMLRHVSYVWGFSEWLLLVESASLHIHTLHFKNISWCYCKCVFKQIVSTWKVYRHGQVDISSSVKVPIIALILTDNQTVKHCLHVCS